MPIASPPIVASTVNNDPSAVGVFGALGIILLLMPVAVVITLWLQTKLLFTLHALFNRPGLFRSLVAGSPSIWWNERAILATRSEFLGGVAQAVRPRLLITVGGDEQHGDPQRDPARATRLEKARMVDNAGEMASSLAASGRLDCEHVVFGGENHISVIPAMLARAVAFTLAEAAVRGDTAR